MTPDWLGSLAHATATGGLHAHLPDRARHKAPDRRKHAAVLMLLSGDAAASSLPADASILLTHRTPTMRSHSGQIAFPGGRTDPGDKDPIHTALRETQEETGINPHTITPLAVADEVFIRATGSPVNPVLGYWHTPGGHHIASPAETDDVFQLPLSHLIDPAHRFTVTHGQWSGPAFTANDYLIWGFTAGLINSLLIAAGWEEHWDRGDRRSLTDELAHSRNNERLH